MRIIILTFAINIVNMDAVKRDVCRKLVIVSIGKDSYKNINKTTSLKCINCSNYEESTKKIKESTIERKKKGNVNLINDY